MTRLGELLDSLTRKSLDLLTASPETLFHYDLLQADLTAMRIEARQLVKTIRKEVQEIKGGA